MGMAGTLVASVASASLRKSGWTPPDFVGRSDPHSHEHGYTAGGGRASQATASTSAFSLLRSAVARSVCSPEYDVAAHIARVGIPLFERQQVG